MITIGVDAHQHVHVALALDEAGREVDRWRGPNSQAGWRSSWASQLRGETQWGIEGAWGYGRGLAQHLVREGEAVLEVNPRWTALGRRRARKPGKSDNLDARAVALVVRQEAPGLPRVLSEDDTAVLELLSNERDQALSEATRLRNQVHALLVHVDPEYDLRLPALKSKAGVAALIGYSAPGDEPLQIERAAAVRRLAKRLQLTLEQAEGLAKRIRELAQPRFEHLTNLCGVNLLTAGTLAGILGPGFNFKHFTACDVFTRWQVLEAHGRATAHAAAGFLDTILERMPFPVRAIQVDGGSEFMARFEDACRDRGIHLFVLPPRSPKLNGHVERAQRTNKEEFYYRLTSVSTLSKVNKLLRRWEDIYNTYRPHQELGQITPLAFHQECA